MKEPSCRGGPCGRPARAGATIPPLRDPDNATAKHASFTASDARVITFASLRFVSSAAEALYSCPRVEDSPVVRLAPKKTATLGRTFMNRFAATLMIVLSSWPALAASPRKTVTINEGTNIDATVSPDHKSIIFCLQGTLWALPMTGGAAKALTDPLLDPARPDWSPKGDRVAFESYSGGTFHIWTMKPNGTGVRQLTDGHGDDATRASPPMERRSRFRRTGLSRAVTTSGSWTLQQAS